MRRRSACRRCSTCGWAPTGSGAVADGAGVNGRIEDSGPIDESPAGANSPETFTGLAFLNPGAETAEISLTVRDRNGFVTGQGQLSLAGGARRSQLLSELLESPLIQTGGYLRVESTHPIMVQEMFGDSALNFVSVVPPTVIE